MDVLEQGVPSVALSKPVIQSALGAIRKIGHEEIFHSGALALEEVGQPLQRFPHRFFGHHIAIECQHYLATIEGDLLPIGQGGFAAVLVGPAPSPHALKPNGDPESLC